MKGLKTAHFTDLKTGTGASIFLFEHGAVGSYLIAGAACASHEIAILDPEHIVDKVHGLVLTGGSSFGLYAAKGVVDFLKQHNIGFKTIDAIIPLVPAAALYDLNYLDALPPTADDLYKTCFSAAEANIESGAIGAGTGATVGKLIANTCEMKSGLGRSEITFSSGLEVIVYAAVNAAGDIHDNGTIIAGAHTKDGHFVDSKKILSSGQKEKQLFLGTNTTLVAVFTNAKGDKAFFKRMSKMAIAGMAQAISPVFSSYDGDIIFCFSLGTQEISELSLGTIIAEQVRLAIIDAVWR